MRGRESRLSVTPHVKASVISGAPKNRAESLRWESAPCATKFGIAASATRTTTSYKHCAMIATTRDATVARQLKLTFRTTIFDESSRHDQNIVRARRRVGP